MCIFATENVKTLLHCVSCLIRHLAVSLTQIETRVHQSPFILECKSIILGVSKSHSIIYTLYVLKTDLIKMMISFAVSRLINPTITNNHSQ